MKMDLSSIGNMEKLYVLQILFYSIYLEDLQDCPSQKNTRWLRTQQNYQKHLTKSKNLVPQSIFQSVSTTLHGFHHFASEPG